MINPLIRIRVAQLLARRYGLGPEAAVNAAEDFIRTMQAGNLDIVLSTWINDVGNTHAPEGDFWDRVSRRISKIDEEYGDWHPWRP